LEPHRLKSACVQTILFAMFAEGLLVSALS